MSPNPTCYPLSVKHLCPTVASPCLFTPKPAAGWAWIRSAGAVLQLQLSALSNLLLFEVLKTWVTRDPVSELISWYSEVSADNQCQKSSHTLWNWRSGSCIRILSFPSVHSCKCLLFENVVVLAGFLKAQTAPKAEKFNKNLRFHQNLPCLSDLVEKFWSHYIQQLKF